ncbi:MAG TPA: DMT family transporter, partial [Gemmataceae bacterium]|nr:DMT family transporter [Gemmataceae bacterium]
VGLTASLGQMLLTRAFAHGEPSKVSVVGLSQVVFTLLIDVIVSHHEVKWPALTGTLLILAPTAWVMLERRRKPAPEAPPGSSPELALAAEPVENGE